jgi:hypothetical protein
VKEWVQEMDEIIEHSQLRTLIALRVRVNKCKYECVSVGVIACAVYHTYHCSNEEKMKELCLRMVMFYAVSALPYA